ncbi:glycosyltransferase family 4 protein [Christiangramia flava]|uniref:Glycosyltransferase n=1 Tax=Christiangramia flava JLT2011 TaxID=1229726 RepID=A0A1L7I694_9FLAO|nr:glycosyltransferase family 4 protein [Christiangramia flava]APU69129.1 Glycosyltransferase [Christiangramia flava JLT2011]OSS38270.1 glycosyl transferase, group 1 family protein [Christiangramia flava JLT2011]
MKTVFIAFTLKDSSVAEFFTAISNRLAQDYKVIIISYQTEKHSLPLDPQIETMEWPSKRPTKLKDLFFIGRLVYKYKPFMMISNFAAVNFFLLTGFLFGIKKRISWYHTHSSAHITENKFNLWRKSMIYKLATKIVTTSAAAKEDISKHYNLKEKKISILPNAVIEPKIIKGDIDPLKLIFVGRLHPAKGFEVLIKALPKVILKYPQLKVEVLGGGPQEIQKFTKMAKDLSVLNHLNFKGFTSKNKFIEELAKAYVCVVPSYFEAFCYVVIESFSVATPVIGSDTTGVAEIIEDGISGYLFQPGNYIELSEKLLKLLDNPRQRKEMAANTFDTFKDKFELCKIVENFMELTDA